MWNRIQIERLRFLYWPRFLEPFTLDVVLNATPIERYVEEEARDATYDAGRTHYLYRKLLSGVELDPIVVDWIWRGSYPERISLIDGHHRLLAYTLAQRMWIPASLGGPVDALEWLAGQRDVLPEWI